MPFFVFIDLYRTRPGTGKTTSLHVTPPVEITPKTPAKIASLNSSIAFGDLRLGGCLRAPGVLWVILAYQNHGFIPQNLRFELTVLYSTPQQESVYLMLDTPSVPERSAGSMVV